MFVRILNGVFEGSFRAYVIRYVRVYRIPCCSHYFVDNATGMVEGFRWHVFLSGWLSLNLTTAQIPIVNDPVSAYRFLHPPPPRLDAATGRP